jgi:hypothetical protein|nr:MAG TPA: hypothetical protein [Caudoviricetes sp.]
MIAQWPPKPRYESAKRLREAVNARAQNDALADFVASTSASAREAVERLQAMQDAVAKAVADLDYLVVCLYDNPRQAGRAQNIHDDLAALLDESERP